MNHLAGNICKFSCNFCTHITYHNSFTCVSLLDLLGKPAFIMSTILAMWSRWDAYLLLELVKCFRDLGMCPHRFFRHCRLLTSSSAKLTQSATQTDETNIIYYLTTVCCIGPRISIQVSSQVQQHNCSLTVTSIRKPPKPVLSQSESTGPLGLDRCTYCLTTPIHIQVLPVMKEQRL